jgi:3-oxoacyl-[acyl-carrier-protein] synthase II
MDQYLDARGRPRIVITGMGAVTPLGNTVEESWQNALAGRWAGDTI